MGGGGDARGRGAGGGVAAAPAPGARGSLRLAGFGPRSFPSHPAGLDSSPRNLSTGICFLGPAEWRPESPVRFLLPPPFRNGRGGGELPSPTWRGGRGLGAPRASQRSSIYGRGLGHAWAVGEGAPGAGPAAQSSFSLGTPTDVSLSAKIREKREPALLNPEKGRKPAKRDSKENSQLLSLQVTSRVLDPQTCIGRWEDKSKMTTFPGERWPHF